MDDKACKFKGGTTTTSDVDLRTTVSGSEFYDVTFKANAKCKNLNVLSSSDAIVNKNLLETGRLVGIQSLSTVMSYSKHELLVVKGRPTNSTIITKHHSLNGNPMLTADSDSVTLDISFNNNLPKGIYKYVFDQHFSSTSSIKVFLYGLCGVGYKSNTIYEHWNVTLQGNIKVNVNGGFFHHGYGRRLTFQESFDILGITSRTFTVFSRCFLHFHGVSYMLNSEGVYNRFLETGIRKNFF